VVGEGTRVGERASIKKSVIGKHCVIHDGVKIINSVIMNHVTISAGYAPLPPDPKAFLFFDNCDVVAGADALSTALWSATTCT
jgi:NDP-sugar pyrophosphorylase family protein